MGHGTILAVTLHQPWAALVVVEALAPGAGKRDETRSWLTRHRGWLAIHAAQGGLSKRDLVALCARPAIQTALAHIGITHPDALPRGAVVALARVRDCEPTEVRYPAPAPDDPNWSFGDYAPGRFAWGLDTILALPTPIPATGAQRLWRWTPPPEVAALLHAA